MASLAEAQTVSLRASMSTLAGGAGAASVRVERQALREYRAQLLRAAQRPVQRKIRVPLFAARTLNATKPIPGHSVAAVRERKSSLWATAGGKRG